MTYAGAEKYNSLCPSMTSDLITSFCYEGLIFCSQRVALFPLDVLLPHVHLLSLLGGVLWGHGGSVAVQPLHHCLILLEQKQCFEEHLNILNACFRLCFLKQMEMFQHVNLIRSDRLLFEVRTKFNGGL